MLALQLLVPLPLHPRLFAPPPLLKILYPPLVSFQKSVISYISWCFYCMELHADHKQVICIDLLILIS